MELNIKRAPIVQTDRIVHLVHCMKANVDVLLVIMVVRQNGQRTKHIFVFVSKIKDLFPIARIQFLILR